MAEESRFEKCPRCERELKDIEDYPRISVVSFKRFEIPSDLKFPHYDYTIFVGPGARSNNDVVPGLVYTEFSKLDSNPAMSLEEKLKVEVPFDGWNWQIQKNGWCGSRELLLYSGSECLGMPLFERDFGRKLEAYMKNRKMTELKLGVLEDTLFYEHKGWFGIKKKVRLEFEKDDYPSDMSGDVREAISNERNEYIKRLTEAKDLRLVVRKEESKYTYHRYRDDRQVIINSLNPYLEHLESLVGKEVLLKEILPDAGKDGTFKWAFEIPETAYNLNVGEGWDEVKEELPKGQRKAEITILGEGPNFGSALGPTLKGLTKVGEIVYRGILNSAS